MLIVSLDPKVSSGITKLDQSKLANDADLGSSNLKLLGSQGGEIVLIDKSEEEKEEAVSWIDFKASAFVSISRSFEALHPKEALCPCNSNGKLVIEWQSIRLSIERLRV